MPLIPLEMYEEGATKFSEGESVEVELHPNTP